MTIEDSTTSNGIASPIFSGEEILDKLIALDKSNTLEREELWEELKRQLPETIKMIPLAYKRLKKKDARKTVLFHCIKYSRQHPELVDLAIAALNDRAADVRYRACCILAYSLEKRAIPSLMEASNSQDIDTSADAKFAIKAINRRNHHLFVDRDETGRVNWIVNDDDNKFDSKSNQSRVSAFGRIIEWLRLRK